MLAATTIVRNGVGLHARPAASLVREAQKYSCRITLEASGKRANGKSVIEILALGVRCGQEVRVCAEGEGEEKAVGGIVSLIAALAAEEQQDRQ